MKRRNFLKGLISLALAPIVVLKALAAESRHMPGHAWNYMLKRWTPQQIQDYITIRRKENFEKIAKELEDYENNLYELTNITWNHPKSRVYKVDKYEISSKQWMLAKRKDRV